jgi:hypothetical protein
MACAAVAAAFFPVLLAAVPVTLAHPEPAGQLAALQRSHPVPGW